MANDKKKLTLTGIIVEDATEGFTGYLLEIPEVIAEGNTPEEVQTALFENLKIVMEFKREDSEVELKDKGNYSTKSFDLELA